MSLDDWQEVPTTQSARSSSRGRGTGTSGTKSVSFESQVPWESLAIDEAVEDLIEQALHLTRGNLSVEVLADQGCVFLGSVDSSGKPDGQGVATNRSSVREERNEYRGDFQGGSRHGVGGVKFGDGTVYQGEWVLDHPKGYGVELYPDGGAYKGRFLNDTRHGLGAYYFANGQRYFGRWNAGVRHGEGVEMAKTGEKFFSTFEMGKRVSKVDLREQRAKGMELLTQVDAASQLGEQRAQISRESSSKLRVLSKILASMSGRDTTVDKLTEMIADVHMRLMESQAKQGPDYALQSQDPGDSVQSSWTVVHAADSGQERLTMLQRELTEVTKAMSQLKQWSKEAKDNFKDEYDRQMLTLRQQLLNLQVELAAIDGSAPRSDDSVIGHEDTEVGSEKQAGNHEKHDEDNMSVQVSECETAEQGTAEHRGRRVHFEDPGSPLGSPSQRQSTRANDPPTGTVPVQWVQRSTGTGVEAGIYLEKGALNDTGIMLGDVLFEVDGQVVDNLPYHSIMPLVNGVVGSFARLMVMRNDEPIRLMVERKPMDSLRLGSATESRVSTPDSEKSERSEEASERLNDLKCLKNSRMSQIGPDGAQDATENSLLADSSLVGKQNRGFVMMKPAVGSVKWTMHQSPRRLAEAEQKAKEAAERKRLEAEEAARREEEELQRRALEEARERAAAELRKKAAAEAEVRAKAEAERKAKAIAEARAKAEAEEAARRAAEEEDARRAEEEKQRAEEEAARKLAEEDRLRAELLAIERARKERIERDRIRLEEDKKKADAALEAGLRAARNLEVAAAKKYLNEAIQITTVGKIADRKEQIQELRVDFEFAQIKVNEMKIEEQIALVRVILQREASSVDGRAFCKEDITEARNVIESAHAACADLFEPAFYLEQIEDLSRETDLAESRLLASSAFPPEDGTRSMESEAPTFEPTLPAEQLGTMPSGKDPPDLCESQDEATRSVNELITVLVSDIIDSAAVHSEVAYASELSDESIGKSFELVESAQEEMPIPEEDLQQVTSEPQVSEALEAAVARNREDEEAAAAAAAAAAAQKHEEKEAAAAAEAQKREEEEAAAAARKREEEEAAAAAEAQKREEQAAAAAEAKKREEEEAAAAAEAKKREEEAAAAAEAKKREEEEAAAAAETKKREEEEALAAAAAAEVKKREEEEAAAAAEAPKSEEDAGIQIEAAADTSALDDVENTSSDDIVVGCEAPVETAQGKLLELASAQELALREHLKDREAAKESELRNQIVDEERARVLAETDELQKQIKQIQAKEQERQQEYESYKKQQAEHMEEMQNQIEKHYKDAYYQNMVEMQKQYDETLNKIRENLAQQNRSLVTEKAALEAQLEELRREAEIRAAQEKLATKATRQELPTSIEEEKLRKAQRYELETLAAEQKRVEEEKLGAKRRIQEEDLRRLEEDRRLQFAELEREKHEALQRAAEAEAANARLAEERKSIAAELALERQRAVEEKARMHMESEKNLAEATTQAYLAAVREETQKREEAQNREEEAAAAAEAQKLEEEATAAAEAKKREEEEAAAVAEAKKREEQAAAAAEAKKREEEEAAAAAEAQKREEQAAAAAEAKKREEEEAAAAEETKKREEEAAAAAAAQNLEEEAAVAVEAKKREEEEAAAAAAAAASEEAASAVQEEAAPAVQIEAQGDLSAMNEDQGPPLQIELVLDMDMNEILGKEEEFEVELIAELCAAAKVEQDRMRVMEMSAGSIIVRIELQPKTAPEDISTQELAAELIRQYDALHSALRKGLYGSLVKSVRVLTADDIEVLNGIVQRTVEGQHWKDLADAVDDELEDAVVSIAPVREENSDTQKRKQKGKPSSIDVNFEDKFDADRKTIVEDDNNHSETNTDHAMASFLQGFSSVVDAAVHHSHDSHLKEASTPVKRCQGTLLTISSDWSEAWEGTKVVNIDEAEGSWLGGCMMKTRHDHDDDSFEDESASPMLTSGKSAQGKSKHQIPAFRPPREIEAWGDRDVMPMHKLSLAARQEMLREQHTSVQKPETEVAAKKPDWNSRVSISPAQPVPPAKRNPKTLVVPGLTPVSPLTKRRSMANASSSMPGGHGGREFSEPVGHVDVTSGTDKPVDEVLSTEAQMELGEFLEEMLGPELCEAPAEGQYANPPADNSLSSDLRRWRKPGAQVVEEETVAEPADAGSGRFPQDDRDAAGADRSNRLSWVPHFYTRSGQLIKQNSRAYLEAFGDDSLYDDVVIGPPKQLSLPTIIPSEKQVFKVGANLKKKWERFAAMSEHERYAKLKKQSFSSTRKRDTQIDTSLPL